MKYLYSTLRVMVYHDKYFPVHQVREAVEYLKTQPQTEFTGLQATTSTTAGPYKLLAQPILPLDQIIGKMPDEAWAAFDAGVYRWRRDLEARTTSTSPIRSSITSELRANIHRWMSSADYVVNQSEVFLASLRSATEETNALVTAEAKELNETEMLVHLYLSQDRRKFIVNDIRF